MGTTTNTISSDPAELRYELVDNWHRQWVRVLSSLQEQGHRDLLRIDADGWLSARQGIFAALGDDTVAGYLCFHVQCIENEGSLAQIAGRALMQAVVDCIHVEPGYREIGVDQALVRTAARHASGLCDELVGFA